LQGFWLPQTGDTDESASGVGKYLTDANGRSVYVFRKDKKNVSSALMLARRRGHRSVRAQ